ncbi:PREDICTED: uncharacterized protein LOC105457283 [Wasmannia auropunctata]|uniref:uncharacterized protein LOC105457283 n=1 Tax=Wasmannia auropunctata TaxID=64793 RepID=UPI0005EE2DC4|nr:PREDICTED: uncharacterized protein LOC105457283 [Wasmannia auropunctata]
MTASGDSLNKHLSGFETLWHHVPGQDNPADCASRGLSPGELVTHPLWWKGPPWLLAEPSSWPVADIAATDEDLPERRVRVHAAGTAPHETKEPDELTRFSSLERLLRVTAWCRRWLSRVSNDTERLRSPQSTRSPRCGTLSAAEMDDARLCWVRAVQAASYKPVLESIKQGKALPNSNSLARLSPFLDPKGILRVGGRLKHAILSFDEKHSAILPGRSHSADRGGHRRALHGGTQMTLGMIRQNYWIPRGRAVVKELIHRCVPCVRWRAATPQQLMGSLPRARVTPARPFLNTGVDYAGPIQLRTTKGRGHKAYKAYIAVFVSLSTRAVHLEVVSDYTADAFLAALRRFTSRRGLCCIIDSDCGTNFVGADAQLRAFFAASNSELRRIGERVANDRIQWRFNPPSAPHFGGLWEAAVKSLKHRLRRVLRGATLTFEEMSTLLSQVEACLNLRPLQALSDDPEDLAALTPGHFLVGSMLTAVPEPSMMELPATRLSRWQMLQRVWDHFWDRWSREYLHSLAHRPKWCREESSFKVGRLCLVRHENTPPTRWPLARIVRVHPGEDDQIRVVDVRTAAIELTRPIVKLVLLPDTDAETDEDHSE